MKDIPHPIPRHRNSLGSCPCYNGYMLRILLKLLISDLIGGRNRVSLISEGQNKIIF